MYVEIPVAQIDRNPDQPRKHFDAERLDELAQSITENGLLEPIIVRPLAERFLIIAGERRWRASQQAGLTAVPARIMDIDEATAYELSVAENVNRHDMTIIEEAQAYATLLRYGRTRAEIAKKFGKPVDMVDARILLLNLEPEISAMVEKGQIRPRLAWYIAKLQPGNQRIVANRVARGELTEEPAAEFAAALLDAEQEVSMFDVEEVTEEDRVEHAKRSRKVKSAVNQIERLSALLTEIGNADPADLADALGAEVGQRLAVIAAIDKAADRAHRTMRKAKLHAEARTLVVTDEASAS